MVEKSVYPLPITVRRKNKKGYEKVWMVENFKNPFEFQPQCGFWQLIVKNSVNKLKLSTAILQHSTTGDTRPPKAIWHVSFALHGSDIFDDVIHRFFVVAVF